MEWRKWILGEWLSDFVPFHWLILNTEFRAASSERSSFPKWTSQNPEDNEKTKAASKDLIQELAQLRLGGRPEVTDSWKGFVRLAPYTLSRNINVHLPSKTIWSENIVSMYNLFVWADWPKATWSRSQSESWIRWDSQPSFIGWLGVCNMWDALSRGCLQQHKDADWGGVEQPLSSVERHCQGDWQLSVWHFGTVLELLIVCSSLKWTLARHTTTLTAKWRC